MRIIQNYWRNLGYGKNELLAVPIVLLSAPFTIVLIVDMLKNMLK